MLKVSVQVLFGKIGQKLRLGALVDFTNAVYQFPFAHIYVSPENPWEFRSLGLPQYHRQTEQFFFSRHFVVAANAR